MALAEKFAGEFPPRARELGEEHFQKDRVELTGQEGASIYATVTSGQFYDVSLTRRKGAVRYECECPTYVRDGEPCQHVYATLLAADAAGYTEEWDTQRALEFLPGDDVEADDGARIINLKPDQTRWRRAGTSSKTRNRNDVSEWKQTLSELRSAMTLREQTLSTDEFNGGREIFYIVDVTQTLRGEGLVISLSQRERKRDGGWGKLKKLALGSHEVRQLADSEDRHIMSMMLGAEAATTNPYGYIGNAFSTQSRSDFILTESLMQTQMQRMCRTGRCAIAATTNAEPTPLAWDEKGTWELWVVAERLVERDYYELRGELRRGEERMLLADPLLLVSGGLVFTADTVAPLDDGGAFPWIVTFRTRGSLEIPAADRDALLQQMLSLPRAPHLELPDDLKVEEVKVTPQPRLRVRKSTERYENQLVGELSFDYGGIVVPHDEPGRGIYQKAEGRLLLRDVDAERDARAKLNSLGFRRPQMYYGEQSNELQVAPQQLPNVIRKLTNDGWYVEADGKLYRQPGTVNISVASGIDWFELHGGADFGGQNVPLPKLLAAVRRGEKMIRLDDGTFGMLPEQWLNKYGMIAEMGTSDDDHIRFGRAQVGVLDALLASQPEATYDEVFDVARLRMRNFQGIEPADAPETFVGELRPYQRDGLGWMQFLREFNFGGCLADDMGLGKTVQVLALLESRRLAREKGAPATNGDAQHDTSVRRTSLVVAPRSLIFNWQEEAGKFSPKLTVLDHTGIGRAKTADVFKDYDLVLTTYGTLRNDAPFLKDVPFDYVVLDEAQAIKNAGSEAAKAARLLTGRHRLALSGTPVQNHLGELWSLIEFLNPGMLGTARAFQSTTGSVRVVEDQTRELLSRALRPFILRRTKQQVAKDLPERSEQTIHCELDAEQRKQYNELKEHYRVSLLSRIATEGIKKAKIQILEALLRLRQAACHPGLIDKSKVDQGSAKLDSLMAQITEVMAEDHKVLVFSQFTSFLAIVRNRLDKEKITYQYLDGRTRDRQTVVDKFQNDPETKLFLISLKAGGLGLNLTAAEYVFLLDPWWNPAVEAQAIDRAHRIGQTRQVFAYRLIAKDTVEEKVLQLQQTKRDLADAIIGSNNSLISKLGREDLELLLS